MTADVVFCVLEEGVRESAERMSCLCAEQCLQAGIPLCIHVGDAGQAERLDQLLWTFQDTSFVPHGYADDARGSDAPGPSISIAWPGHALPTARGLLFHLAGLEPARHTGYTRLIEVAPRQPTERQAARVRYRRYQELGCALDRVQVPSTTDRSWVRRTLDLQ